MYHEVLDDEQNVDAWTVIRASEFRKQMEYLKSHHDVISLDAACELMRNGGRIKAKYAVVTFDDGYSGNRRVVLPIMAELNLPFTVFCATGSIEQGEPYWWDRVIHSALACRKTVMLTDMLLGTYDFDTRLRGEFRWNEIHRLLTDLKSVERQRREQIVNAITRQTGESQQSGPLRPMTPKQVRELADAGLATIGAHSHTHDILTQLTPEEAEDNILRSKKKLEAWTGKRVDYFSYPNGDYSPALMCAAERAGFLAAMSTEERAWRHTDDVYAIPRIGIGRFDSLKKFKLKI
jgi:peptidoglycan/xylan/chitin deacetylase (PgdA/CDA1 family)